MKIYHQPILLEALQSSTYGLLWTRRGIQIVRPRDYIVRAPTGCTWRIRAKDLKYYKPHIQGL